MTETTNFGKIAYEAYLRKSGGKSLITGIVLPTWEEQLPHIREAWEAAAEAVLSYSPFLNEDGN